MASGGNRHSAALLSTWQRVDQTMTKADADDALALCARLQQLYSAPWVLDTNPACSPWAHRSGKSADFAPDQDRARLVIPEPSDAISLPVKKAARPVSGRWAHQEAPEPPAQGWTGELLGMPGPHQSLSAGIVYAHFKTPLSAVIKKARTLLNQVAKEDKGRAAFAAAIYSRGGVKVEFGSPWQDEEESTPTGWPEKAARMDRVREAFAKNQLPGRLPYKLRESAWALEAADGADNEKTLLEGLVIRALSHGRVDPALVKDVVALWSEDSSAAGLLLCRALASEEEE